MNFVFATVHVKNLEESVRFYENVIGLKKTKSFPVGAGTEIAFLADGGAEIELICNKNEEIAQRGSNPSLAFATDDLDKALADIKAQKAEILSEIIQPNPATRFFFIHDPNGVTLQIIDQK